MSVCVTSGWYCKPYILRAAHSMATSAPCSLVATTSKPGGSRLASSPWDIHTICEPASGKRLPATVAIGILPYSRFSAGATSPPRHCTSSCMP